MEKIRFLGVKTLLTSFVMLLLSGDAPGVIVPGLVCQ